MSNFSHLCHIEQVDLKEEAQSAACDLIGSSTNGVAEFAPDRESTSPLLWLEMKKRKKDILCSEFVDFTVDTELLSPQDL